MKSDKQNLISFPDPVLTEKPSIKNYIKYIAFFGPGAIVASITIGQGQTCLTLMFVGVIGVIM